MKLLTLSIGNTSLFGGIFTGKRLGPAFRSEVARIVPRPPATPRSLDTASPPRRGDDRLPSALGQFDRAVLCSVVPRLTATTVRAVERRCGTTPLILTSSASHGLKIGYKNPRLLGTDRLAAALGARVLFPRKHIIVVDCGTATTVTALDRNGLLLGGAIFPGLALWPVMLASRTAQLPHVAPRRPIAALGRSPRAAIAAGVYHGHAGAIRELVARVRAEAFSRSAVLVIGTGGHAAMFAGEKIFDELEAALVLHGLRAFADRTLNV